MINRIKTMPKQDKILFINFGICTVGMLASVYSCAKSFRK